MIVRVRKIVSILIISAVTMVLLAGCGDNLEEYGGSQLNKMAGRKVTAGSKGSRRVVVADAPKDIQTADLYEYSEKEALNEATNEPKVLEEASNEVAQVAVDYSGYEDILPDEPLNAISQPEQSVLYEAEMPVDNVSQATAVMVKNSNVSGGTNNFDTYDIPEQQMTTDKWVINLSSGKIHFPDCDSVKRINPENYSTSNLSEEELLSQGYKLCGNCFK